MSFSKIHDLFISENLHLDIEKLKKKTMERTIFLTAVALLFNAGITAQSTDQTQIQLQNGTQIQTQQQNNTQAQLQNGDQSQLQTRKRDQLCTHNQTGAGDQLRKRDQTRLQDPSRNTSGTGTRNAQMRSQNASHARKVQANDCAPNSAMNRNMRMSYMSGARRR